MRRIVLSRMSVFLAIILLLGVFPMSASAADNEYVLTSIDHTAAVSEINMTGTNTGSLTVPYNSPSVIDLSNGLDITYDTSVYSSATASFPGSATAVVDGDPVTILLSYQKTGENSVYTTSYSIRVVRAANPPTFTGTIAKTFALPGTLTLTDADFTAKYTKNGGGELSSIAITGSNPSFGALKLNGNTYVPGANIALADLQAGKLTFAATAAGTVSYIVKAYAAGDANTQIGSVTLTVTVTDQAAGPIDYKPLPIQYNTVKDTAISFRIHDFDELCEKGTGKPLSYVKFTLPAAESGKLWYNRTSETAFESAVAADTAYNKEISPFLSKVFFMPASGYTGTVAIAYTAYNTAGASFSGEIKITVAEAPKECYFTDVSKKYAWASEAVQYLYDNGILQGYKNRHFKPDASISRGDFTAMLAKAFDLKTDKYGNFIAENSSSTATDSTKPHGGSKGHGHNEKGPHGRTNLKASLSRQDAMVLLVSALDAAGLTLPAGTAADLQTYSDYKKISGYAADPIAALIKAQVLTGDGRKLNPNGKISRAEIAVVLYRVLQLYSK